VPAPTSSRIPAAAKRLDTPVALAPDQCRSLLDDLATITDPRQRRGRRHGLGAVLAVHPAAAATPVGVAGPPVRQVKGLDGGARSGPNARFPT
jgi:hypothetical protein